MGGNLRFFVKGVNRILRNRTYCGYYVSGATISPFQERLQIIDEHIFDQAQRILDQRSGKYEEKQQIARTMVSRGYALEVTLDLNYEQFLGE